MFHWLLKSLEYNVRMVSAAVSFSINTTASDVHATFVQLFEKVDCLPSQVAAPTPTGFSFPTDHLINLVKVEDCQFLCDVGFGKHTFTTPIPLEVRDFQNSWTQSSESQVGVHSSSHGLHRVVGEREGMVDLQKWDSGQWSTKCRIDLVTERVGNQ